jgi:lipoprotein signal peptidase
MNDPTDAPTQEPAAGDPPPAGVSAPEPHAGEAASPPATPASTSPADGSPPAEKLAESAALPEPLLAPEIPRLDRPMGTALAIPETILGPRPSPSFLAVVSIVSLVSDVVTKLWAEKKLEGYPGYVNVLDNHLMFVLAKNKGGAWGLLQGQSENVRRPFFLLVSVAAIAFIVTLYQRLQPRQHALKWGLPLVLGGALGNVFDRIRYGFVIDFIDYRADWIRTLNELIQKRYPAHIVTDHWPTFNVADIAICVGVGLMAVDMLTSRRGKKIVVADVPIEPVVLAPAAALAEAAPVEPIASEAVETPGATGATGPEAEAGDAEAKRAEPS